MGKKDAKMDNLSKTPSGPVGLPQDPIPVLPSSKDLSKRLSKRLASFELKDDVLGRIAERVLIDGLHIKRFDVCMYGICIDYHTGTVPKLEGVFSRTDVARVEVFPYGIIGWDHFHVRVGFIIDELAGRSGGRGLGH